MWVPVVPLLENIVRITAGNKVVNYFNPGAMMGGGSGSGGMNPMNMMGAMGGSSSGGTRTAGM
jgi:hypothetical protein